MTMHATAPSLSDSDPQIKDLSRLALGIIAVATVLRVAFAAVLPAGVDEAERCRNVRAGFFVLPKETDWLDHYNARRAAWSEGAAPPVERRRPGTAHAA